MNFTAKIIADFLKGEIDGNPEEVVTDISKIEEGIPGTLSFLANPQYAKYIYTTEASIVIVNNDFVPERDVKCTLIRVENAYQSFASLLELYNQGKKEKIGVDPLAFVHPTANLGENIYIGAFAYIGENAKIGDNTKIYPQAYIGDNVDVKKNTTIFAGVKIYENCKIGANCTLHCGVVIGADGFGFAPQADHNYKKVPQVGNVIVEDNVEIGANTAIDRATLGSTRIKKGVKLDNLIQIAHNVEIGENTVIAAQSGVAGSSKVGKDCMIGGQVGISGHLTIANGVKIAAQSGISSNIKEENLIVQGSPAFDIVPYQKSYVLFKRLPDLRNQILELEKEIKALKEKINN